jgi:hypothetical protein
MKWIFLYLFLAISCFVSGQEITGTWYSKDRTRIYHIYKMDDHFEAVLEKSSRERDREGAIILRHVKKRGKNREFEGEIYSVDQISTFAKIKMEKDGQVLRLRLKRFFVNVTIKWYRGDRKITLK